MSNWQRYYSAYARQSLFDALRVSGVTAGDSVLVPAFICRDVLAPIHAVGATVEFYDVDMMLRPTIESVSRAPRAIIAVDYFGFVQDLRRLSNIAEQYGATIIEDNAHGLFSRDEHGVPLGERTGIGFTSFRKTLRVVNGAFLVVDLDCFPDADIVLGSPVAPSTAALPLTFRARRAVSALEVSTGLRLMRASRNVVRVARRLAGRPSLPQSEESETEMPPAQPVHASALRRLERTDPGAESDRRRDLYRRVATRLRDAGLPLVFDDLAPGTVPWSVPYFATTEQSAVAKRALHEFGLDTFLWPDLPAAVRASCPDFYTQVNVATMMQ